MLEEVQSLGTVATTFLNVVLLQMEEREVIRKHMISVWTDLLLERASSDDLMLSQVASLTWLVAWPELLHGISNH